MLKLSVRGQNGGKEKVVEDAELEAKLNEHISKSKRIGRSISGDSKKISKRFKDMRTI